MTDAHPLSEATQSLGRFISFPGKTFPYLLGDRDDTVSLQLTLPAEAPVGPGSLDPTFGIDGTVTSEFGTLASEIHALAEQPDGKVVAAGFVQSGAGNRDFALARYNTDGTLDTSFGTAGRVVTDVGAGANDAARAVAIQDDGKIVVAGYASVSGIHDFALARYHSDGSLDDTFGKIAGVRRTGMATYNLGATDEAYAVAVQDDHKIVAAGQAGNDFGLLRVHPSGDPDADKAAMGSTPAYTGFGGNGIVTSVPSGRASGARALALSSYGIVVAGFTTDQAGTPSDPSDDRKDVAVARFTAAGVLDSDFAVSQNGFGRFDFGSTEQERTKDSEAHAVTVLYNGKIVVAGRSGSFLALLRLTTAGVLDTSFGAASSGGVALTPGDFEDARAYAVADRSDNRLVVVGQERRRAIALNLSESGTTTDGDSKTSSLQFNGGVSRARAMVLRNDDSFVVAGYAHNGSHNTFALARFTAAHTLDEHFGIDGKVTTGFTAQTESAEGVAVSPDGAIFVVGHAHNGTDDDFLVARYAAAGFLNDGFGIRGRVFSDFGSGSDRAFDVALQSDGKIVVVGRAGNGTDFDFAVARYNVDGSLDTAFDTDGKVVTDFGSGNDGAESVVIASDGKIVVGGYASNGVENDFAVVRYNTDGSLDTAFGTGGKVTTDFEGAANVVYGLAVQSDGKIVAVGQGESSFSLARYTTAGVLDTTFGTGGKVTTKFVEGRVDQARAVAMQRDGRIVVAGRATNENGTTGQQGDDHHDFALARYTAAGVLDTTFGTAGKVTTTVSGLDDEVRAVAVQIDGRVVVAGTAKNDNGTPLNVNSVDDHFDFALARYNADGSLDTTFGTGGKVITGDGLEEVVKSVALQSDGNIVVAGNGWGSGFALARYLRGASAKVYEITPAVTVSEIQDALLELTLGVPAPAGGVTFDVTYGYGGTVTAGDLVYPPATVTVNENQTTATLTLALRPDGIVEGTETLPVTVSTAAQGWAPIVDRAMVTITDNDIATARIGFGTSGRETPYTASVARNVPGGRIDVPIEVNHLAASDFTVLVEVLSTSTAVEYSDAQNPGDFRIADKSVTFRFGSSSNNLAVEITNTADMDDKVIKLRITDGGPDDLGRHFARHAMGRLADITITDAIAPKVTITDTGTPGITISNTAPTVARGQSVTYTVRLNTRPTAGVTVAVAAADSAVATVTPATLTFTPQNFQAPQSVRVRGIAEGVTDITHTATSIDNAYNGRTPTTNITVTAPANRQERGNPGPSGPSGPIGGGGGGNPDDEDDDDRDTSRLWGADRYATSLRIAEQVAEANDGKLATIVLAGGHSWTDALAAAPLAGTLDAALVLTAPDGLAADTVRWLAEVGVTDIIAVGDDTHIPDAALEALNGIDDDIERITAADPYATSAAVAARIGQPDTLGPLLGRTVIVASGQKFPDALAAGPLAAAGPHPVLYADTGTLDTDIAAYLAAHADHVIIMGGTAAVTQSIEGQIRAIKQANRPARPMAVTRHAGTDRYHTAALFARWLTGPVLEGRVCFTADTAGLATGTNPADATASGPLLAHRCAPLLLTEPDQMPQHTRSFLRSTTELIVFGGTKAINNTALQSWTR